MSQYKNRDDWKELLGKWKVTCDRSGFVFYSDEIMQDHKGRLINRAYYDPVHWTEKPLNYPLDVSRLPFKRPINNTLTNPNARLPWGKIHVKWRDLQSKWSDT